MIRLGFDRLARGLFLRHVSIVLLLLGAGPWSPLPQPGPRFTSPSFSNSRHWSRNQWRALVQSSIRRRS
jgi:hypothetical protein